MIERNDIEEENGSRFSDFEQTGKLALCSPRENVYTEQNCNAQDL